MKIAKNTSQYGSASPEAASRTSSTSKTSPAIPVLQQKQGPDTATTNAEIIQKKTNNTGLPDTLKTGIENLSGFDMSDVKVHYNSPKPTQLQAFAYAQGSDIHVAAGQEKHLPHEAWHVVQQKQGRVQPTLQMKAGVAVNDDAGLEHEADVMGGQAMQMKANQSTGLLKSSSPAGQQVHQLVKASQLESIGKQWHKEIWIGADSSKKKEMIDLLEESSGFKSGTVFHAYDLYIRGAGASAYKDIVKGLVKKDVENFLDF
jgi:hypothetical protein